MKITKTIAEIRSLLENERSANRSLGFVPTMGALHEGHLSLVRACRQKCGITIVSIFVNPTQFGPAEDLDKYPRSIEEDIAMLESAGADVLFLPTAEEMYPHGSSTFVIVEDVAAGYEGAIRPTHFRGVATVVASLFHIVQPDIAFFGQKDLQQVAVIKKMVRDLHVPIRIEIGATVREADGLAMSSRNRYLSSEERAEALILSQTLAYVRENLISGLPPAEVKLLGIKYFDSLKKRAILDYLDIIDPETFHSADSFKSAKETGVVIAAKIGATRLIDNILLEAQ